MLTASEPPAGRSAGGLKAPSDLAVAIGLGVLALVLYAATVPRTLAFWDCGEFIACSAIFGIPHPPGSPLYILWGRLFAHGPWPADIALRVNLVSVVFGALSVSLAYLIVARLARRLLDSASEHGHGWLVVVSGVCGAVTAGFASTVWTNATEAEVYALTLFLFFAILFAMLLWSERPDSPEGSKLLIWATFLAALGLGVHMMVYLALPGLWLCVFVTQARARTDWRIWAAALASGTIMVTGVEAHLVSLALVLCVSAWHRLGPASLTSRAGSVLVPLLVFWGLLAAAYVISTGRPGIPTVGPAHWSGVDWVPLVLLSVLALAGTLGEARTGPAGARRGLLGAGLAGASLVAFSLLLSIPVRSAHDPGIDENDPESWVGLRGFLERKQYGRESMIERMLTRRGEWSNQLGRHPRMGFWSFFEAQYGLKSGPVGRPYAFLLLVGLGLWGVVRLVWKAPRLGLPWALVLLLCTVGLVVYMNFADGTRYQPTRADQAYLEVRDRDYFFTTGFALFGLSLGLGTAAFLRAVSRTEGVLRRPLLWAAAAVFLFSLPGKTVLANHWTHDRSRDFVALDYARNMLHSCEPGAILFTSGDNDTFPLWCLQEAYGERRDVNIVNLSLANTHWYVRQAKAAGVPLTFEWAEIDRLRPSVEAGRIQDQVVNSVLEANRGRRPVYFGASTPEGSRVYRGRSLDSQLVMEGLVLRLGDQPGVRQVNAPLVWRRYTGHYSLRGLGDTTLYLDDATRRIADNYASALLFVADHYRQRSVPDSALLAAAMASRLRPELTTARHYLVQLAGEYGHRRVLDSVSASYAPEGKADLHYQFGLAAEHAKDPARALAAYKSALAHSPSHAAAFQRGAALEFDGRRWDSLLALVDRWVEANPQDTLGPKLRLEVLEFRDRFAPDTATP